MRSKAACPSRGHSRWGKLLSGSPTQGHTSDSRAHKCCWLFPGREATVWWPAGSEAASLHQAMGTTTGRYLCQPSTRTYGSGTLLGHRALPTALFPRKPLEIISCPAPAAPGTGTGSSYPAPTSEQRSIAWKRRGISLALAQDLHHTGQPALSAFPARANHKRITTRNGEKSRRHGPPAFPGTPRGVSPARGYPGTPEADRTHSPR